MKPSTVYKKSIAENLNCPEDNLFLFWKGRVALYSVLKAIGVSRGDEVILQAFTCVVVPNAIIYTGATPIYIDVQEHTFNMILENIKEKLSAKTKVVIIQNTFGLSSEADSIVDYCNSRGIICIEDCTHGFGGLYNGKSNGSLADFAFYSTQWNKPFSTGIGGILRVNNSKYLNDIVEIYKGAIKPSFKENAILAALITARKYLLNDTTYWLLIKLYRKLTAWKLVVGSSSPEEIEAPQLPEGFLKQGSMVQFNTGVKALNGITKILELRRANSVLIEAFLSKNNKQMVLEVLRPNHSFLIYPILVKNRDGFLKKAEDQGLPMGDWFISPIHPVKNNFHLWQLNEKDCPNAIYLSKHILNIPLDKNNIARYLIFLENNSDQIL